MSYTEAESNEEIEREFSKWMSKPLVRKLISEIGPCDYLEDLLKDCFQHGMCSGMIQVMKPLLRSKETQ